MLGKMPRLERVRPKAAPEVANGASLRCVIRSRNLFVLNLGSETNSGWPFAVATAGMERAIGSR
jgi:hypothetical protein